MTVIHGANDTDIGFLPILATACCVPYNISEIHGDHFNGEWLVTEATVAPAHLKQQLLCLCLQGTGLELPYLTILTQCRLLSTCMESVK